jgi:flagellar basal body-associated protein FliL
MPTHEWTMANDGSPPRPKRKTYLIIAVCVLGALGLGVVLFLVGAPAKSAPGSKSYRTNVDCQVNTVGSQSTVTINGTIIGDAASYSVTVEVVDAASHQRIGVQTFEVRGTTSFGGKTAAQVPAGPAGIECRIAKVA